MKTPIMPEPPKSRKENEQLRFFHVAYSTIEHNGFHNHGSIGFANQAMFNKNEFCALIQEKHDLKSVTITGWQEFANEEDLADFGADTLRDRSGNSERWFSIRYSTLRHDGVLGTGNSEITENGMFNQGLFCASMAEKWDLMRVSILSWTEFNDEADFKAFTYQ